MMSHNGTLKYHLIEMTVFWDLEPCSRVEIYRRFTGIYCFHHDGHKFTSTIVHRFALLKRKNSVIFHSHLLVGRCNLLCPSNKETQRSVGIQTV
jgi:hypothetical protein